MGLDMYAYTAGRNGQYSDWWADAELDEHKKQFVNTKITKPVEIAYWRKHPNLHGWMEQLWRDRQYQAQSTDASEAVESAKAKAQEMAADATEKLNDLKEDAAEAVTAAKAKAQEFAAEASATVDHLKAKATEFMKSENVEAMKAEAAEKFDDLKEDAAEAVTAAKAKAQELAAEASETVAEVTEKAKGFWSKLFGGK